MLSAKQKKARAGEKLRGQNFEPLEVVDKRECPGMRTIHYTAYFVKRRSSQTVARFQQRQRPEQAKPRMKVRQARVRDHRAQT